MSQQQFTHEDTLHSFIVIYLGNGASGSLTTAEFKAPRDYFSNTEEHTTALYLSVGLSFQGIDS